MPGLRFLTPPERYATPHQPPTHIGSSAWTLTLYSRDVSTPLRLVRPHRHVSSSPQPLRTGHLSRLPGGFVTPMSPVARSQRRPYALMPEAPQLRCDARPSRRPDRIFQTHRLDISRLPGGFVTPHEPLRPKPQRPSLLVTRKP